MYDRLCERAYHKPKAVTNIAMHISGGESGEWTTQPNDNGDDGDGDDGDNDGPMKTPASVCSTKQQPDAGARRQHTSTTTTITHPLHTSWSLT